MSWQEGAIWVLVALLALGLGSLAWEAWRARGMRRQRRKREALRRYAESIQHDYFKPWRLDND